MLLCLLVWGRKLRFLYPSGVSGVSILVSQIALMSERKTPYDVVYMGVTVNVGYAHD